MNIKDIAKIAGVSFMTVSRVVNNQPNVDKKTRERILDIIKKSNYFPHFGAKALRYGKNYTLGILVVFDINNIVSSKMFFEEIIVGITKRLNYYGYNCNLMIDNGSGKENYNKLSSTIFNKKRIDGLLIISNESAININYYIKGLNIPIVVANQNINRKNIGIVISDDEKGAYDATKHLIELGHEKIGLIDGPTKRRKNGYLKALKQFNIYNNKNIMKKGNFSYIGGYQAMNQLLNDYKDITAVFSVSDFMTIGAMEALKERGKIIPNDFSIVSFDDYEFTGLIKPLITSVRKPRYQMGEKSVDLLVNLLMSKKEKMNIKKIILPTELIVRGSTRKLISQKQK